ncbi:HAMP domain-containing sensor histidine kinase [Gryllotalpicola sp.]|uniref:sensor histidine kinase n=1 Tax=Gryllotalpicola sp. TaxID=1932787 RepID=UPI0026351116|nr:HAMP domain-containing sensor histidine kinase [Gryllotalpicola sp.]
MTRAKARLLGNREVSGLRRAARRLTIAFTALISGLFVVIGGVVVGIVAFSANEAQVQALQYAARFDSAEDAPPGTYLAIQTSTGLVVSDRAPSGFPVTSILQEVAASGGVIEKTLTLGGERFAVRTAADSGRVVQVALSTREKDEALTRLLFALLFAGVPGIGLAALTAWWMSGRAMRPMAEALALQRRFVADAGHELRTPLTLLSTRVQLLARTASPEQRTNLGEVVGDAKALTAILDDLLVAADPRQDANHAPVALGEIVDEAVRSVAAAAEARDLVVDRVGDDDVTVLGTRAALYRLTLALVSNALDHARTRVRVSVAALGKEAVLEVADDGAGFPPGSAERVFERFASLRAAPQQAQTGEGRRHYGLGLALVDEVAARHGGRVEIGEAPEGGGLITVHLPRMANE